MKSTVRWKVSSDIDDVVGLHSTIATLTELQILTMQLTIRNTQQ